MDFLSTSCNRVRRSTAGINKRYDEQEYVLVSFPQLNKHGIVPAASIDIDPLDKQNGSIKTFGSRKNLRIVGSGKLFMRYLLLFLAILVLYSGSKAVMKERASRYAVSAGSEEVELVPDEEENNENQDTDEDEYSPSIVHRMSSESVKRVTTSERSKPQIDTVSTNVIDQTTTTSSNSIGSESKSLKKYILSCFLFKKKSRFIYIL